jgi:hypothetical protein
MAKDFLGRRPGISPKPPDGASYDWLRLYAFPPDDAFSISQLPFPNAIGRNRVQDVAKSQCLGIEPPSGRYCRLRYTPVRDARPTDESTRRGGLAYRRSLSMARETQLDGSFADTYAVLREDGWNERRDNGDHPSQANIGKDMGQTFA